MIPEINKTYNCFDDGKISKSRLYTVKVTKITPFDQIDDETLKLWYKSVKECYWLYNEKTDFFIFTDDDDEIFVRTKYNKWYSLANGILDVDNSLTQKLHNI